jgi:preprotein translocase subunit SecD
MILTAGVLAAADPVGNISFNLVEAGPFMANEQALEPYNGTLPKDRVIRKEYKGGGKCFVLHARAILATVDLKEVKAVKDSQGAPALSIKLKPEAAKKFQTFTRNNIGKKLAIVINHKVVMAPVIRDVMGEALMVHGHFTEEELTAITRQLSAAVKAAK